MEERGEFEEAEKSSGRGEDLLLEEGKEGGLEEGDEEEFGEEDGLNLAGGRVGEEGEFEVRFPGFEEGFDAPAEGVDLGEGLGIPELRRHVGNEDLPAEEVEVSFGGVESFVAVFAEVSSALRGDSGGEGKGE